MSTPVATADELETFLGMPAGTIDTARATLLLEKAQQKCERIIKPCPSEASDIVLEVAGRAYNNVAGSTQMSLGSASTSLPGGLYLSKSNKAELRLIAGRGSAFSADTMPTGTNAVQTVTVAATAGSFTLSFQGHTTTALAFDATPAAVQAALEALPSVGAGNVAVSGAYAVRFVNRLGLSPMSLLVADGAGLTGTVSVVTTTTGVAAPGTNLPPWGRDYGTGAPGYPYGW
jgi:hypothetical protein